MPKPRCVCGCGQRAVQRHHALYRQHLRQHGGDVKDERNLVWMAVSCHASHHSGARKLRLRDLPDSVFEFSRDLLGGGLAFELLGRYYAGDDPRLDALLAETV
jgi:hypothetical protein